MREEVCAERLCLPELDDHFSIQFANFLKLKAIGGGGGWPKILDFLRLGIFCSRGYVGTGTFDGIQKYCTVLEIRVVKVGTFSVILP